MASPTSQTSLSSSFSPLPTATPSFAKAKLLEVFLTGVRMLEKCLVASLGDLRGVREGEKLDDKEVRLVADAISLGKRDQSSEHLRRRCTRF